MAKQNPPMIVVHDALVDLGFLYSLFAGPLPLAVNTFQSQIHKDLFPQVTETKWLLTEFDDLTVADTDINIMYWEHGDQWFPSVHTVTGMGYTLREDTSLVDLVTADPHEAGLASTWSIKRPQANVDKAQATRPS